MQTSLVLLVLRKPFSLSSVSVTASTSIVFGSEGGGGGGGVAPLLSGIVRWEVEARRVGKRRSGKERVGDGKWGVWEWKFVVGGVKSWKWRGRVADMVKEERFLVDAGSEVVFWYFTVL